MATIKVTYNNGWVSDEFEGEVSYAERALIITIKEEDKTAMPGLYSVTEKQRIVGIPFTSILRWEVT